MDSATTIASVITTKLKSLFNVLTDEFGEEVKHTINNNILEYQVEEYNRNFFSKTLLHRVQPKSLKEFYQPLFISKCQNKKSAYREPERIPTHSVQELFSERQFITLLGNAGSGKSTIVKYLFLNSIEANFKVPIKIELRYLNEYSDSIISFIKEKVFKLNKLATHERIIERLMNSGDFIFFLDGYDEITSLKKEKITKEIDDLVKLYNKNYYLLTSRPYTEIDLLPLFHNFEVCELSDDDINEFIQKQIPSEEQELSDKIIEAVNNHENISYKTFLSNPLLLSMFILTFQSYSSIPQKRSEFYSQVFDALYSVHDSMSKMAFVREKQSGLSKEQIVEVLKLFSFLSYFDEKFIFSNFYLQGKLRLIKDKKKTISFNNEKLINDLQIAIGVLNKEGTDYSFPHRSLQEYFAASYIASISDDNKKIVYSKIVSSLTDKKSFRMTSRDNFHLLLSELDEKGIIEFGLIPYLEKYLSETNLDEIDFEEIIDNYLAIHSIFSTFYTILDTLDTMNADQHFNEQYQVYKSENDQRHTKKKETEKFHEHCRKQLALNEIKTFLVKFKPVVVKKRQSLIDYLVNENKTDSDIISLM